MHAVLALLTILKACLAMPIFCCYFVDRKDRVKRTIEIEALSLGVAINQAQQELKASRERLSFELWEGARRVHPEHRDDSIEEAARRLETLLGSLAGAVREPRPHKLSGVPRDPRVKGPSKP